MATIESYRGRRFDARRPVLPLVLLDEGDERLDSRVAGEHFTGLDCPVVLFPGGNHRFEHMEEALPRILRYADSGGVVAD
jgi:predicted esterase YcpF (UPF0227 family)